VESARQALVLEAGGVIRQETRLWDQDLEQTEEMRGKEDSPDYRYFPDPDLPVLIIESSDIDRERDSLPESHLARKTRYIDQLKIDARDAESILARREFGDFFDQLVAAGLSPASASNWFRGEVLKHLNDREESIEDYPLTAASIAEVVEAVEGDRISVAKGREILQVALDQGCSPAQILAQTGEQVSDEAALIGWVQQVVDANPDAAEKIRAGDSKPLGFLTGQVMKASSGQAHPRLVQQILQRLIQHD